MRFYKYIIPVVILLSFVKQSSLYCSSPYELKGINDVIFFGSGIALSLTGLALDQSVKPLTSEEIEKLSKSDINPFDRSACNNFSKASDLISYGTVGLSVSLPITFLLDDEISQDATTLAVMYGEVLLTTAFTALIVKSSGRIRPYVYNPDAQYSKKLESEARQSFFSGHTAFAFSSAVFFSTVYSEYYPKSKWTPYIWSGTLLAAAASGFLRYEAGMHFPTDIITGAIVGSLIGYFVPYFHKTDGSGIELQSAILFPRISFGYKF